MWKYILRAFKYFVKLILLFVVLFALMVWSGTSSFTFDDFFAQFFGSLRGQIFSAIVILWCAYYPRVEFVKHTVKVDFAASRQQIIEAMHSAGMSLTSERDGVLRFRSASLARRVWQLWEDCVEMTVASDSVTLSGSRRNLGAVEYKIRAIAEQNNA